MSSPVERDEQLALLCSQLPLLRRLHQGPVGAARRRTVDQAVRAARTGEPVEAHLVALGLLGDRTDPVHSEPDGRSSLPTPVADDGPHTVPGTHVCPRGVCARREQRRPDRELPVCEVFDVALRFDAES
ncbi:hypothetical protein JK359_20155 [Streptomyces actinomycinicus]|uniref:Uncharacterized protein n=1 Tax=Streptomyces actinomycinicus TaxID=1695166 RepID=A0A937JPC2_9ACTN|nr:hypothetical protein [Streptomyces actinomycinicus]MBL1084251.1 hypothetical protein [Streptomyces actinomycinicus]